MKILNIIINASKFFIKYILRILEFLIKFVIPTLIASCALCFYLYHFQLIKVPTDVPIIYEYDLKQNEGCDIVVESLNAKVIFGFLNLLNHTSIIQYQLVGKVSAIPGKRPSINAVHFNLIKRYDHKRPFVIIGDIQLTPIVEMSTDKTYDGTPITYNIKIGHYFDSLDWGENEFYIKSLNAKSSFKLYQSK